jgi:aryl-alcohol dehydrogenase-like predicted oxidoreductase
MQRASRSQVTVLPIPGNSTVAHFDENMGAALVELTPDQVRLLDSQEAPP